MRVLWVCCKVLSRVFRCVNSMTFWQFSCSISLLICSRPRLILRRSDRASTNRWGFRHVACASFFLLSPSNTQCTQCGQLLMSTWNVPLCSTLVVVEEWTTEAIWALKSSQFSVRGTCINFIFRLWQRKFQNVRPCVADITRMWIVSKQFFFAESFSRVAQSVAQRTFRQLRVPYGLDAELESRSCYFAFSPCEKEAWALEHVHCRYIAYDVPNNQLEDRVSGCPCTR